MYQAEQDIAIEEFSPFNNRKLLMVLLSFEEKHRKGPRHNAYRAIIEHLWKEVLEEPINPLTTKEKVKRIVKDILPVRLKYKFKELKG